VSRSDDPQQLDKSSTLHEHVVVVLLSVTTILTAWSAFEASKWGGEMSIAFSQASAARIESARLDADANQVSAVQLQLWTQWLNAYAEGQLPQHPEQAILAKVIKARFPEPLATAQRDWWATDPSNTGKNATTPFSMPSYQIAQRAQAEQADARAAAKYDEALTNNQRGDNYTLLTVLFAAVLFFTALSSRLSTPNGRWTLLGIGLGLAVVGSVFLASFPKLV
jgi:hypothetical protein